MRRATPLLLLVCLALLLAAPAHAERRVALVIGNGAYPLAPLKNPVNDARDMATALRDMGFEVISRENANLAQMEGAVNEFWERLKKGGAGLFYFAGHGLQVGGRNYLLPVDVHLAVEQDAKYKSMDAGLVLGRMENAGNGLNIVILDACRNNPFARSWRSSDVGLAKMDAPKGSIIAYATAPDSVASDGRGRNGVYTENLLRAMRAPGQPVEQVFKRVRDEVMRATGDKQVPWESTSLRGDFYFVGQAQANLQAVSPGASAASASSSSAAAIAAEKQRLAEESERLKREKEELAQVQALRAEQARLAEERKRLEVEKTQLAMAPLPEQPPSASAPLQAPVGGHGKTWRDPVTGMEFVWVPGGGFEMGCGSWAGECYSDEKPSHTVRLSGFWLGKYEVTQGQWREVMGSNPSSFKKGDNYPVENVSWLDVKEFISRLNALGAVKFRLPVEAEWEYAARSGGRQEKYSGGNSIDRVAWYGSNSGGATHPVGAKAHNGLGLHDMSGNVWEWCEDARAAYPTDSQNNSGLTGGGVSRVFRGGSWINVPKGVGTVRRLYASPEGRAGNLGFRLVLIPD